MVLLLDQMALNLDMEPSKGALPMKPLFVVLLILEREGLELVGHLVWDPLSGTLKLRSLELVLY
jgi:hypothetical protein